MKNHKSLILSPDIIWLLIVQGFSHHLDENHENLRSMFVSFQGKKTLEVKRLNLTPNTATDKDWADIIDEFVELIGKETGKQITDILEPKFSTTTYVSHTAGCVSIMSAMKHYFEYRTSMFGCGFPSIIIEGTLEDWELIKQKTEDISKYDLSWWTRNLFPIIDEFINVKKGEVNKEFWLRTFRHKNGGPYEPRYFDGWICNFFPYYKSGKRKNHETIGDIYDMPSEILTVPLKLDLVALGKTVNCELHAGFMGVKETRVGEGKYNVKPVIGWGFKYDVSGPKNEEKPKRNSGESSDILRIPKFPEQKNVEKSKLKEQKKTKDTIGSRRPQKKEMLPKKKEPEIVKIPPENSMKP